MKPSPGGASIALWLAGIREGCSRPPKSCAPHIKRFYGVPLRVQSLQLRDLRVRGSEFVLRFGFCWQEAGQKDETSNNTKDGLGLHIRSTATHLARVASSGSESEVPVSVFAFDHSFEL